MMHAYRVRTTSKDGIVLTQSCADTENEAQIAFNKIMDFMEDAMRDAKFPYDIVFVSAETAGESEWELIERNMVLKS